MPEFHVGDKVVVLYTVDRLSFTVAAIDRRGDEVHYSGVDLGNGVVWWPESRLDYDLSWKQKEFQIRLERALYQVIESQRLAQEALKEAEKVLPGWLILRTLEATHSDEKKP